MSRKLALFCISIFLLFASIVVWVLLVRAEALVEVSFLKVGQGDAILIQTPQGVDVLIDGGKGTAVLRELGSVLGPLDRRIDMVVATHGDQDHVGGLSHVFSKYRVDTYLKSSVENDTESTQALEKAVAQETGVQIYEAKRGMRFTLSREVYLDVLFPDRDVSGVETNTGSVVLRLTHGSVSFMLTGDAPQSIEEWLVTLDGKSLESEVLKAGHHGSRTSTSESFLQLVTPTYAVISAGEGNSYGHPHEEVVQLLSEYGSTILSTFARRVTLVSDGERVWEK